MTSSLTAALLAALLGLVGSRLAAASDMGYFDTTKYDPVRFPQLAAQVPAEMAPGGRFEEVAAAERELVEEELGRMAKLSESPGSLRTSIGHRYLFRRPLAI